MRTPSPDAYLTERADQAACRHALREGSRSFYASSLLLPKRVRGPAAALYAFCRVADDAVDGVGDDAHAVARLRGRLARAYDGKPAPSPIDRAFAATVARFGIPRALPEALLEGLAWDTTGRAYEDLAALNDYAARVAGSVGVMMSMVMGTRDPYTLARACDLGIAMQLTNIARDVGEDARAGRLYLPRQWLHDAGIDPDAWLTRPRWDSALAGVVRRLLDAADRRYRRAEPGIADLPPRCRPAIYGARFVYDEIGRQIERGGLDSISRRAIVGPARKLSLLAKALLATPLPRSSTGRSIPEEGRFLIEAVQAAPPIRERRAAPLDDRAAWVIALFDRLERRDQMAAVGR